MAFDDAGRLYCIQNESIVKINTTMMNVPPLNIGVINLTLDTATGTLYVPNGTDTIGFYDLSGNPL